MREVIVKLLSFFLDCSYQNGRQYACRCETSPGSARFLVLRLRLVCLASNSSDPRAFAGIWGTCHASESARILFSKWKTTKQGGPIRRACRVRFFIERSMPAKLHHNHPTWNTTPLPIISISSHLFPATHAWSSQHRYKPVLNGFSSGPATLSLSTTSGAEALSGRCDRTLE